MLAHPTQNLDFTLKYKIPDGNSVGWLDFIEVTCSRNLVWSGPQMSFRDANTIGKKNVTEFTMTKADTSVKIWDVTDKENISLLQPILNNGVMKLKILTDTLREFIAFNGAYYYPVSLIEPVANQNLHGIGAHNLVIVTHPLFKDAADSLAEFHRQHNSLSVVVVTTSDIYNEFGCGKADLTAIRDFMKMIYDRNSPGNEARYLLLFGDGSYDPKSRVHNNNNMVPTYQSAESLKFIGTYVTDDYFGILGDKQGDGSNGTINIGIGRFPVTVRPDASILLKKIFHYSSNADSVMSDWRNTITFIADDENRNLHMHQAEELVGIVKAKYPVFNIEKIYLDSYKEIQVPAGLRFPDVNIAINHAVAKGSLIINYTGHGGEDGWAGEKVLTVADIKGWKNSEKLPVFITATCEFSRFDNPERFTAGEMVLMQPDGGAIALYSTTRLALSTSNFRLDSSFFENMLPDTAGAVIPKMGDLIRISKNNNSNNNNIRNFVLLGDPAQDVAFPKYNIKTTEINHTPVRSTPDTAMGLATINVKGEVIDNSGNKIANYNGMVFPKVFDKKQVARTLGNTEDSYPENFDTQNSVLYEGRSTVTNGGFEFSFVVPKSISLQFGNGKISYYAKDSTADAWGYFNNILIGGSDPLIDPVNPGPDISAYMNNTDFRNGDKIGTSANLLVFVNDTNGINFTRVGIGHEIIAVLDGDAVHPIVLNDYFTPNVDQFWGGEIIYPIENLSNGRHTLRVKAWDLYNNSSEKEIYFFVSELPYVSVQQVNNYPNPVTDNTSFQFVSSLNAGNLDVEIRIFNLTGRLVRTISSAFPESNYHILTILWDGTNDQGGRLSAGLYLYRMKVTGSNGASFEASQKLIIAR